MLKIHPVCIHIYMYDFTRTYVLDTPSIFDLVEKNITLYFRLIFFYVDSLVFLIVPSIRKIL